MYADAESNVCTNMISCCFKYPALIMQLHFIYIEVFSLVHTSCESDAFYNRDINPHRSNSVRVSLDAFVPVYRCISLLHCCWLFDSFIFIILFIASGCKFYLQILMTPTTYYKVNYTTLYPLVFHNTFIVFEQEKDLFQFYYDY